MKIICITILMIITISGTGSMQAPDQGITIHKGLSDDALIDLVQEHTFRYFWDGAEPNSRLANRDQKANDCSTVRLNKNK